MIEVAAVDEDAGAGPVLADQQYESGPDKRTRSLAAPRWLVAGFPAMRWYKGILQNA
jgi:uncharacterized membrane protein